MATKLGDIGRDKYGGKQVWQACPTCGKERWVRTKANKPKYQLCILCAIRSRPKHNIPRNKRGRRIMLTSCPNCRKERWVVFSNKPAYALCRSCSIRLRRIGKPMNEQPSWKGGKTKMKNGYILIKLSPDDFFYPMVSNNGYVLEHRLVMAKLLGRLLSPKEIVHHINDIRDDNRQCNLQLFPDCDSHFEFHRTLERLRKGGDENKIKPITK